MRNTMRIVTGAVSALVITGLIAPAGQARPTWDTSPVVVAKLVKPQPKVINARVAAHANYDRVVIDLDGKVPGYTVRYVKNLFYDGSGEPVPVHGRKFISVVLTPAKAHKEANRLKIAELKQTCPRPEVVEVWDVTAQDPKLLVYLKVRSPSKPFPRGAAQ